MLYSIWVDDPHTIPTEPGIPEIGWLGEGARTCDSQVHAPGYLYENTGCRSSYRLSMHWRGKHTIQKMHTCVNWYFVSQATVGP